MTYETNDLLRIAESYYNTILKKDSETVANYLCPDIRFISPLVETQGKENVVAAAKNLMQILEGIHIRSRFVSGNQVMFAYDFKLSLPIGKLRAAVLMDFRGALISRIELFYDTRPFEETRDSESKKS